MESSKIDTLMVEMKVFSDLFQGALNNCHNKCVSPRYAEGDLNKGESVCVDRCVAKYFQVHEKVGERLQAPGITSGGSKLGPIS